MYKYIVLMTDLSYICHMPAQCLFLHLRIKIKSTKQTDRCTAS